MNQIIFYDLIFLAIFSLAVGIFLYIERKKLVKDGWMYLYKTSIGLKFINYAGKKFPKTLKALSYVSITCGYFLMAISIYFLVQVLTLFLRPEVVKAVKIPPIMPLIPYLPELFHVTWLPPFYFTYWIVAIALIAIFHEGFHGIFARFFNIKIKSTGFGFLGPFLAFFVEQDDKQMQKAKPFAQMSVLSAGVFANVLLSIIFFFLLVGFFNVAYSPQGAIFNDYSYMVQPLSIMGSAVIMNETLKVDGLNFTKIELENKSYFIPSEALVVKDTSTLVKIYYDSPSINSALRGAITSIDNYQVRSTSDISKALSTKQPGDNVLLTTRYTENNAYVNKEYDLVLGSDYANASRPVLGIASIPVKSMGFRGFIYRMMNNFKDASVYYEPKANEAATIFFYNLIWWIFLINLSVAIANMLPFAIFDGGRFLYLTILIITRKEKWAKAAFKYANYLLLAVVVLMMLLWAKGLFF